ncbi:MAG: quinolinate synthase NadA [Stappiaceae bacterium]
MHINQTAVANSDTDGSGINDWPAHDVLPMPSLDFTEEVAKETAPVFEKVKHFIPSIEWPAYAPYIHAINMLKKQRNAVLLAHNYMTPDIFHGVGDFLGDSLQLARKAQRIDADVIVQCGVHFMAETSKILSPDKTVLIPDREAGCSLASSITAADVRNLREMHPGVPIITYVNTSADVKAECDICCTSSNAVQVVESMGTDRVLLIPDQYLAKNVARQTEVEVLTWAGSCEVHERFTAEELREYRQNDPGVKIIAHPECPPDVVAEADFSGSTAHMIDWVKKNRPEKAMLVTECSMADNVAAETPDVNFVRPCNLCPHMKRITLPKILNCLLTMKDEVHVDPAIAAKARQAVQRMIDLNS